MTTVRIGTRRSALATAQAELVAQLLKSQGLQSEIVALTTTGDEGAPASASPQGLKGLWIDTILDALRHGEIDVAVHSAKDLPAEDDDDLTIGAVPWRAEPNDVLVLRGGDGLAAGMVVGTSSIRRQGAAARGVPRRRGRATCVATSTRGCASSREATSTPRCSRPRDCSGSGSSLRTSAG